MAPVSAIKPHAFERGLDKLYIVAPVAPFDPADTDLAEFAFADQLKKMAPNEVLMWLRGNYVEADNPNANGQEWTAGEIALKSLTPMFMPVTVMHDPRTAVGLIADVALRLPEKDDVPRSRLDTSLALWSHRFPEVAEETLINYKAGSLMQSMECVPTDTEILTKRGWLKHNELRKGDFTLGVNPTTGKNEWTRVTGVLRKRGQVSSLGHNKWRVRCTEGHRWMTREGRRVGSKFVFDGPIKGVETANLSHRHQLVLNPEAALGDEDRLQITPAEAAVIGWIAGDGTYRDKHGSVVCAISQAKPDGVMALEMDLAEAGIEYRLSTKEPRRSEYNGVVIQGRHTQHVYAIPARQARSLWTRAELDHLSWDGFVLRLSDAARKSWLEAVYQAEGNENHGSRCIGQNPGPLKDAIALAAYLCGYRPVSHLRDGDNTQPGSHIRLNRQSVNGESLSMIPLGEADVWCPQTELGSWTMRQDGRILLTGNCVAPTYSCAECGQMFHKLPEQAERKNWCTHLSESDGFGNRRLEGVVFTGTGLIFGTRGAKGAYDQAHLEVFEDEIAEFHEKTHRDTKPKKRPSKPQEQRKGLKNVETVEISKNEYDRLQEAERETKQLRDDLEKAKSDRDEAVKATEEAEAKQKEAETAKDEAEKKVKGFEEQAQKQELSGERMEKLGSKFLENLGEFTRKRLGEQASDLSDDEWEDRLKELEEQSKLKRDAKKDGEETEAAEEEEGVVDKDETASAHLNGGGGGGKSAPAKGQLRSVVAGLISPADKAE